MITRYNKKGPPGGGPGGQSPSPFGPGRFGEATGDENTEKREN